ncbi:MAG: HupE/UreJ family protein [Nonlabens sp.]
MKPIINKSLILTALLFPVLSLAHDVTQADQLILNSGNLLSYVQVGATHMLTGYDHLLFLLGVIFFLKNIPDILKFITAFTLGHCLTLITGTYLGWQVNEFLIDGIIALSVVYKGVENLGGIKKILGRKAPHLLIMVGIFGLIHGLGLSTRLQSFNIGTESVLLKILSFNLGVELGQIIALIPIIILLQWWRRLASFPAFYKAANTYLVLAGIFLFLWQVWLWMSSL